MPTKQKFFGTDGVRGVANAGNITPEVAMRLGQAAATELILKNHAPSKGRPVAVIGKDTRRSGDMLESAIAAGLNSAGVDVELAGVVPTPAVSYLVRATGAQFGVVISASHNPPADNGIKFFGGDGYKLSDADEGALETAMLSGAPFDHAARAAGEAIGRTDVMNDAAGRYIEMAVATVAADRNDLPLEGMKLTLDTANGASSFTSRQILEQLGAEVLAHHKSPDGDNINVDCGCTYPKVLQELVAADGTKIGISHDGDADRILLVDENGSPIDGDELLALIGCHMLEQGRLAENTLVVTKMTNYAMEECIAERGGKVERTEIGDRHVMARMREIGANFGGEQSGHVICRDENTTGDGILAALAALRAVKESGKPLSELRQVLQMFPQTLVNIRVKSKPEIADLKAAPLIAQTEATLGSAGRVLIRYSGTEPKMRILVEGKDGDFVQSKAQEIADAIATEIGE